MFHWYGLIVGIAAVAGLTVAERIEPKLSKALPGVLIFGLLGARLYHVIDLWDYYSLHPRDILAIWNGGLGIFGGIIGGVIGVWLSRGDRWKVLGALSVGLPLSQAIGRWGNLVNDELWGKGHTPLFLYESVLDLLLFVVLWRVHKRHGVRRLVGMYLLGYGFIRLLLEPMKADPWWVGYVMIGLLIACGMLLWVDQRRTDDRN